VLSGDEPTPTREHHVRHDRDHQSHRGEQEHREHREHHEHQAETARTIDCDECVMQGTSTCDDCVVSFVVGREPGTALVIDAAEVRAVRLLAGAGLLPELRHVAVAR
jgi:hypothetical protein